MYRPLTRMVFGLLLTGSLASADIVYDWTPTTTDGNQGWQVRLNDTTSYTAVNPYQYGEFNRNVNGSSTGLIGAPAGNQLNNSGEFSGNTWDAPHTALVFQSPVFTIGSDPGDVSAIEFDLAFGVPGSDPGPARFADLFVGGNQNDPIDSSSQGFVGVGLFNIGTADYDLLGSRTTNGSNFQTVTWDSTFLAANAAPGDYRLHLIDTKNGGFGHVGLGSATLTTVVAIPEPGSMALIGLTSGGLLLRRRRR